MTHFQHFFKLWFLVSLLGGIGNTAELSPETSEAEQTSNAVPQMKKSLSTGDLDKVYKERAKRIVDESYLQLFDEFIYAPACIEPRRFRPLIAYKYTIDQAKMVCALKRDCVGFEFSHATSRADFYKTIVRDDLRGCAMDHSFYYKDVGWKYKSEDPDIHRYVRNKRSIVSQATFDSLEDAMRFCDQQNLYNRGTGHTFYGIIERKGQFIPVMYTKLERLRKFDPEEIVAIRPVVM